MISTSPLCASPLMCEWPNCDCGYMAALREMKERETPMDEYPMDFENLGDGPCIICGVATAHKHTGTATLRTPPANKEAPMAEEDTIQYTHLSDGRLNAMVDQVWRTNTGDIEPHEVASLLAEVISSRVREQATRDRPPKHMDVDVDKTGRSYRVFDATHGWSVWHPLAGLSVDDARRSAGVFTKEEADRVQPITVAGEYTQAIVALMEKGPNPNCTVQDADRHHDNISTARFNKGD